MFNKFTFIPSMTSSTFPSGTITTNAHFEAGHGTACHAFDSYLGSYVQYRFSGTPPYLCYQFPYKIIPKVLYLVYSYYYATNITVQASNDGNNWINLIDQLDMSFTTFGIYHEWSYVINTNISYAYYRFYNNVMGDAAIRQAIIQIFGFKE